ALPRARFRASNQRASMLRHLRPSSDMQVPSAVSLKSSWCAGKHDDSQSARGALTKPKAPGAGLLLPVSRVLAVVHVLHEQVQCRAALHGEPAGRDTVGDISSSLTVSTYSSVMGASGRAARQSW